MGIFAKAEGAAGQSYGCGCHALKGAHYAQDRLLLVEGLRLEQYGSGLGFLMLKSPSIWIAETFAYLLGI